MDIFCLSFLQEDVRQVPGHDTASVRQSREILPPCNSRHFSSKSPDVARNSSLMHSCFLDPRETALH